MKKVMARLLVVVVVGALGGGWWWFHRTGAGNPDQLLLYGNVDIRQVRLAFQESGRLLKLHVQEGDRVRAGTLLAEIDADRYQAALDRARAELEARQQTLNELLAGARPQEIARARAEVKGLEAQVRDREVTLKRLQSLIGRKAVAQQQVDDAVTAHQIAVQQLEAARQTLALLLAGPRREEIAAARAQVAASRAQVALAEKQLRDTRLLAPADGIVRDRILEPGDMASPATPVLTLALVDPLWVRTYVPETMLGRVKPGMKAAITTDSFPGKVYPGWVGYLSPTAEFTPKNVETPALRTRLVYQLRVFVCNPEGELRLGMPATVRLDLSRAARGEDGGQDPCGGARPE